MIRYKFSRALLACAMAASFSGCWSAQENLYVLEGVNAPQSVEGRPLTVLVGPVVLPELVDRPQLVIFDGGSKVIILEQERWATPLKESLPRLFTDEFNRRVSDRQFVPIASPAVTTVNARLIVDVNRFEVTRGVGARISAHWVYRFIDPKGTPLEGDSDIQIKTVGSGMDDVVQSLQRAGIALADDIANHLTVK